MELTAARDACYADDTLHSFYNEMLHMMQSYSSEFFNAWLDGVIACMRRFRVSGLEQFETFYYWLNEIGDGAIKILMDEI